MCREATIIQSEELLREIASVIASHLPTPETETIDAITGVANSQLVDDSPASVAQAVLETCKYSYELLDACRTDECRIPRFELEETVLVPLWDMAEEMFESEDISVAHRILREWTETQSCTQDFEFVW